MRFGLSYGLTGDPGTGRVTGVVAAGAGGSSGEEYESSVWLADDPTATPVTIDWSVSPNPQAVVATTGGTTSPGGGSTTSPVTLTVPGGRTVAEGQAVSLAVTATGVASPAFSAIGLPPGLSLDPNAGIISGTVANGDASDVPYTSVITLENAPGGPISQTLIWTVTPAPTLTVPDDQEVAEGDPFDLSMTVSGVTDPQFPANDLPPGLSINAESGEITGTVEGGAAADGPYATTVTVTNAAGVALSAVFFWEVCPDPTKPTLTGPADQTVALGQTVSLAVTTTNIVNPIFSAEGLPPGLDIDYETGEITGTIDPTAALTTPYVSTISVAGRSTGMLTTTVIWTVIAVALTGTAEGEADELVGVEDGDPQTGGDAQTTGTDSKELYGELRDDPPTSNNLSWSNYKAIDKEKKEGIQAETVWNDRGNIKVDWKVINPKKAPAGGFEAAIVIDKVTTKE